MQWEVILHMGAATLLYVAVTAGLWKLVHRRGKQIGKPAKLAIGLIYGACSVAANHFGIDYGSSVLNVRDIGPLAAGLFFSPVSGVIAGTIGGIERVVAGEIWEIGRFSEIACGLSTFVAGVLAAVLSSKIYKGRRVPVPHAFFLGAVTEVFHMYAILFTNRDEMSYAYEVVKTVSIPMIVFTAIGMTLCSAVIMILSGDAMDVGWKAPEEKIPLAVLFQRALLVVTVGLFVFSFITSYNLETRLAIENASDELTFLAFDKADTFGGDSDTDRLKKHLTEHLDLHEVYFLIGAQDGTLLLNDTGAEPQRIEEKDLELIRGQSGQGAFRTTLATYPWLELLCVVVPFNSDCYLVAARSVDSIFESRDSRMYENTLSDILLFTVLYILVAMLADRLVVRSLHRVNDSLRRITGGKLDERVWVHTSSEFTELSEDINQTVGALRGYIAAAEQKMKEELKLAAAIQDSALPKNFNLPSRSIELYALMTPARQVGGDFYDFFYIGVDQVCFVIADVSGKGVPASLFMMRAKTAIKNYARSGNGPADLLMKVNNTLCEGNSAEMFVTVWLGILDLKTGKMQCANAGHEYPALMRAGGDYSLLKDRHGLVLAAMEDVSLSGYEIQLNPGDRLFVYTDGVPEAINGKEEAYGTNRMISRLNRLRNASQERTLDGVLQDIRNFAGKAEQFDDITMLGLTFLGNEPDN